MRSNKNNEIILFFFCYKIHEMELDWGFLIIYINRGLLAWKISEFFEKQKFLKPIKKCWISYPLSVNKI